MAIVKRKNKAGNIYYFNDVTKKFSNEEAFNRSKGAAKKAKTQFKTAKAYVCSNAASILGKKEGKKKTPKATKAGRTLRACRP
jgi:hypothetical protein